MGRDRDRAGGMAQCRQQESPPVLQLIFETTLLVGPNSGTEHSGSNWTTDIGHRTFETMGQQHNKGYCVHILNELPLAFISAFFWGCRLQFGFVLAEETVRLRGENEIKVVSIETCFDVVVNTCLPSVAKLPKKIH